MADEGSQKKGSRLVVPLLVAIIVLLAVVLFTVTPLRNIIFPEKTAPEITLALVELPSWDEEQGVYSFLVEAAVTGNPAPDVSFSRNDDLTGAGPNRSFVFLEPGETFLLEATATNTEGIAEAVIELIADEAEFAGLMGDETADHTADDPADSDTTEDGSPEESADGGEDDLPDEAAPGPHIIDVIYRGESIIALTGWGDSPPVEYIPCEYAEEEHEFTFLVSWGEDGGSRSVSANISHGRLGNHEVFDVNQDRFIVSWLPPASTGGSLDPLEATVQFRISTNSGAYTEKRTIGIVLEPVVFSVATIKESIPADSALSGYVTSRDYVRTGTVMVGDDNANSQIKGYLTFNLSSLSGISSERITAAEIRFSHVNKSGNPEGFSCFVDFKVFNYGTILEPADFAIGGSRFYQAGAASFGTGLTARGSLITELRRVIDAGGTRLQVKIGLDEVTDNDGAWDNFQFNPGNVFLDVEYY
ncbi:MAG TPA: hypothetical protein ENN91_07170 [Firmicutes bacterium]|nr:hypothetical protein [Bacillota bacterium]